MALLAAYSFDEIGVNTVIDHSGNGNHFSIANTDGVRNAGGHTNGGLSWANTAGGYPTLPDIGRTDHRTVMAWLKDVPSLPASWAVLFRAASIDSGAWGILWLSGQIHIQARNASTLVRASGTFPADAAWHHISGTFDATTVRLYVDGTLAASAALAGPLRTDTDPPVLLFDWTSETPVMDDLRLHDVPLSQSAVTSAMNTPVSSGPIPRSSQYGSFH